jgi:DNA-binding FrmR family transcriptional regulator
MLGGMSDEALHSELRSRLRRVEGQIRGIIAMIDDDRDCADVVTQFAAAMKALEHAGFKYFAATLAECARDPDDAAARGYTPEKLEKLFLQLA